MSATFIGSIIVEVKDLDRSLEWYVQKLGMRVLFTEFWGNSRAAVLAVHPTSDAHPWINLEETGGELPKHGRVSFNLKTQHAAELYVSLQEQGVHVSELVEWTPEQGNRYVLFDVWDPDGQRINIIQWYPVQEEAETRMSCHCEDQRKYI